MLENDTVYSKLVFNDASGPESLKDVTNIDKIPPSTTVPTATATTNKIIVTSKQKDDESGIVYEEYAIKENGQWRTQQLNNFEGLMYNTKYVVKTIATDLAGNVSESEELEVTTANMTKGTITFKKDNASGATLTIAQSPTAEKVYVNNNIYIILKEGTNGKTTYEVLDEGGNKVAITNNCLQTSTGTYYLKATTTDGINKIEQKFYIYIDKTMPTTTAPTVTSTTGKITLTNNQTDLESGIAKIEYGIFNEEQNKWVWQDGNTFARLEDNKEYKVKTRATDKAGNIKESAEVTIKTKELLATTITVKENDENKTPITPSTTETDENKDWTNKDIIVETSPVEGTTVTVTVKDKDGNNVTKNSDGSYTTSVDGKYEITVTTNDEDGNSVEEKYYVFVDKTNPTLTLNPKGKTYSITPGKTSTTISVTASATDDGSGIGVTKYAWSTSKTVAPKETEWVNFANNTAIKNTVGGGTYYLWTTVIDNAGNIAEQTVSSAYVVKYQVVYDANGGTGAPATQTKTHGQNLTLSTTVPTWPGHTFEGWSTSSTATKEEIEYAAGATYTKNVAVRLYAVWEVDTYNITYNLNGGSFATTPPSKYTYGVEQALPTPTKTGYTFGGWYEEEALTNKIEKIAFGKYGDLNIYAKWTANKYTVAYNGNGATSGSVASKSCTYDVNFTVASNGFTKTGYTFKEWNTSKTGNGTPYTPGATVKNLSSTSGATVTLYAIWEDKKAPSTAIPTATSNVSSITITFNQTDDGSGINESTIEYGIKKDGTWEWQKEATFTGLHSNTEYEIKTRASDNDGNGPVESAVAKIKTAELKIGDLTFKKNNASGATITPNTDTTSTKKWINTNIYITLNASSNGTTTYTVKKDSGTETTYTQNQTITTSTGTYTIKVSTTTGVDTHEITYYIYVDKTLPTSTVPTATSTTGKITVTNKQTDSNSQIAKIEYGILKDGAWVWQTTNEFSGLKAGTSYEVRTRATDKAGNVKETASVNISTKELTASSITITESESGDVVTPSTNKDDANKTWTNENIKIVTTAPTGTTDEKHIYKEDGTEVTQNADGSYTLTDGTYKIEVTTQDADGNSRTDTYYVFVDKTNPVVTVTPNGGKYVIEVGKTSTTLSATINVTENESGIELTQYKWSTSQTVIPTKWDTFTSGTPVTYSATGGNYYLWINVKDKAENKATKKITSVYKVVYKVEYDANGGTNAPASQEKVKGTNLTLSSTIPTRPGHTFEGWSTSSTATKEEVEYAAGATYSNNAAVRLYAVWNAIPYNITYNLNGGKFNTEPDRTYIINEKEDQALSTDVSRPGYDFDGWYNTAGQKVETIPARTIGDITLEAHWTARTDTVYTVNYYLENANNTNYSLHHSEDKTGTTDAIITLSDVQVPTTAIPNSTYNSNSLTSTTKIDAENKTTVNVYYKRKTFKLTLVAGDNITSVTGTNSYKWGQSVTINATIANLAGYTYKWNKWTSSNTTILANQPNQSATITMPSADITLTASATRTIIEYTITKQVKKDGVLDTNKTETIKYNVETANFELTKEDIAGYTFKGWTINDQAQLYDTITITKGSTGNNTYTAMYVDETVPSNTVPTGSSTTNEITLTFKQTDEGSGINQSTIEYGIYRDGSWKWSKNPTFSGLSANTDYKVKTRVTDNTGNGPTESLETTIRTKSVNESTLTFRKTSSTGAVVSFPTTDNSSVWVNTNIHVTLNSSTTAGVTTTYKIVNSSGTEQTLNSSNVLSTTTGKYIATVTTTDGVNTKTITYYIYVDKTKPAATVTPNGGDYTIAVGSSETTVTAKITGSDTGGSNVKTLQYAWSTSNTTTPTKWTNVTTGNQISKALSGGTEYIWTKIVDNAGNTVTKASSGFNVGYAIEYGKNEEDTTPAVQRKVHNVNINLAEAVTRTGYNFKEWNTKLDGTGTAYAASATYTSNQAIKLYAQWTAKTYNITYDLGGGTIVDPDTFTKYESYTYNTEKVLPTKTDVTKPGYELDYWVDSDGNQYTTLPAGTIENITLSAHWKLTTTTYTIYHYVENIDNTNYSLNSTQSNVSGATESVVTLANLKKTITGATYKQGSLTAGGTAVTTATLSGDGSTKIYLYYTRNTYKLTVNKNADIGSTTGGGTYKYGKKVAISAVFANLPGYTYTWSGWTTTTTGITVPTGQSTTFTMPAKNVTLTANASKTIVNYSITYNLNGGSLASGVTNPSTYTVETAAFTLNNPTKTGYTFDGWDDGSGNVSKTVTVPVGTVGNKTYTAKWTINSYKVTYDYATNGGTSATKTTDKKDYGTAIDLTPTATKDGYTFVGWNTNKAATTALTSLKMGTSNVTLYAIFSKEVTVTYNANGGTDDITQTYTMYNNQTSLSITTPETPTTYSEWTFLCYGTTASATSGYGLNETITATVEINQNSITYYTNWKKDITVKFIDYKGTTKTTREVNVVAYNGGTASVTAPAQNTYTGWTAKGWTPLTTTTATGTNVSGGTYTGLSANKIYYGLYHQTITLSYNLNGGTSSAIASQTGTRKVNSSNINSISNPSLKISTTTPTRSGYTFANWKDSSNNSYTSGTSYTFTKTTQISASWNIVTYNITYDLGGGSLPSGVTNPSTYTVETETITLNDPTKTGYVFRGWQLEGETTVSKPCHINQGSIGDKKYIAIWDYGTDTEYKVEYYYQANGSYPTTATNSDVRTGTTNDSVSVTAEDKTPTQTGYVFDSNASNVLSGTIAADGSLILKVYFKQQFTVTYKAGTHASFATATYSKLDYGVATPSFKGTINVDAGYEQGTWTPTIANTVTSNVEYIYNAGEAITTTPYKVEYYYQVNGNYPTTATKSETRTGTTDTSVTLSSGDKTPTETGYVYDQSANNVTTGKIAGNGSLVLKVYFKQQFTVTYKAGTNVTFTTETHSKLDYGVATPAFEGTPTYAAGYENGVWTPTKATTVTANVTYTLNAQANTNTKYTVEYYYQTNGKYPTTATSSDTTRTGTTAKTASVTDTDKTPTKTGYVFDSNASNVLSGKIAGNGSLVLKVYFKQQFTVTYKAGTNVTFTTETHSKLDYGVTTPAFEGTPTYAAGYGNGVWTPTIAETVTADATYTLNAQANTNTKYTVEYYYQTNGKYPTTATSSDNSRTGTTAKTASVTAADKTPTKTGYVFDSNASNVLSGTIAGNGSLVLKVYFKQQFTVTYKAGEHVSFTTETKGNLDYGVATPAFEGTPKYDDGYGNGVWTPTKATTVTANVTYTLNAQALDVGYKVEYYYQTNGTYPTTATSYDDTRKGKTATTASVTTADKTPTKTGYVFDSNASNVLSGTIAGNGSLVLKVYFKQQFTVKYLKGTKGTFKEETYTNLDYGTATPAFSGTKTGAAGYTFSKWSPTVASKVTANATYTAVFTANTNTPYTVHVYGENAENTNYTFIKNVTKTGTTDSTINVSTIKDSLEGYGKESIVAKDANGNTITTFTVNGNGTTEVYLYYSRNKYTLNLVAGTNIKTVTGNGTYKWGSTVNISATMNNDSGNTYNWLNWTSSDKTILADQADQNATITMPIVPDGKTLTLTANATANANEYSITYENLQGATNSQNPTIYTYGTTVTFSNPGSRTGYTFKGWYADSEYITQITGISATQKGNVIVYAKWEINKYKVTYNAMGGTCDTGIIEDVPYNTAIDLSIVAKKPGYVFIGWNTNENATIKLNSLKMGTSDVTLYAIYHEAVAQMGDKYYETLQEAINEAGTTASTITVLKPPSTQEVKTYSQQETQATIAAGQNITLKMEGNTIESTADTAIINNGTLTIENGTVKSTADTAIINNGTLTIKTGTVSSTTGVGIIVNGGTVNIGINEATPNISVTNPTIIGSTKGIEVKSGTLNFYDGQIKGSAGASISGTITGKPTGCVVVKNTSSNIETAVLGYTITYNHNETRNYIAADNLNTTVTGFTGAQNQLFTLGKLFIDDLKVGDKLKISFGAEYTSLTAATGKTASLAIVGEGINLGTTSTSWTGTGTNTYISTITVTSAMLTNSNYTINVKTDYYSSGSITISNLKAVRVATQTVTRAKGATLGTLPTISNTTYTLKGWYTSATGGTKVSSSTVVNGNATYYAQWTPMVASTTIGSTTTKYSTVQAAVNAAGTNSGATVTLLEPRRDESITIASGQNINFDLNGRILESTTGVTITNNGTLTLTGSGKVSGSIADTIVNNGTFVKNGTSKIDNTTTKEYRPFRNKTTSSVATLNEGTLTCSNTEIGTSYRYIIVNNGTLTVAGATIKADVADSAYERGIINNDANAKVIVNSGNIITNGMAIYNANGTLNTTSSPAIKVAGGTIEAKKAETIYNGTTGMIYLTGGTINQNNTSSTVHNNSTGIIQVSGATIQNKGTGGHGIRNANNGTVKVTKGLISTSINQGINGSGTITVTGGTISSTASNAIISSGTLTVSGGTIQKSGTVSGACVQYDGTGTATLSGGTIKVLEGSMSNAIFNSTDGTMVVSGATIQQLGTGRAGTNNGAGTLKVTSGSITANANYGLFNNSTGTIQVTGGTVRGSSYGISVGAGSSTITGGTIEATNGVGVDLNGGNLTLGTNETTPSVSVTNPTIIGTTNGVKVSSGTFKFYDGQIKGAAGGSISGTVADKPTGYAVVKSTSSNIETAVLGPSGITITAKYEDGTTYTSGTWTNKNVNVTLSIENAGAGIKQYEWKEGSSGTWKTDDLTTSNNGGTIKFTANRNSTIYFRAVDNNNVKTADGAASIIIRKETTLPTVTLGTNGGTSKILVGYSTAKISTKLTASDTGGSNLKTLQYAWSQSNTTEPTSWTPFTSGSTVTKDATGGNWYLWTKVLDNAGNRATSVKVSNVFKVTYQVLFDGNGGTVSTTELTKTHGTALTLSTTATRTGYKFLGWGTSATTISASYPVNSDYRQDGAIKLFAVWEGTATFDKNYLDTSLWNDTYLTSKYSASGTVPSSKTTVTDSSCKYGQYLEFTMPAGTSGGPFYNNSTSLTVGKTYTWSVFVKASSAKTLYMGQEQGGRKSVNITTSWQKFTYTFTATEYQYKAFTFYLASGNTWTAGDKLYVHSLEIMEGTPTTKTTSATVVNGTLGTLTTPTRTGYTFQGWYDAPSGGNKVSSTTKFTANTTYYAHWTTNNYTITYNYNSSRNYIGAYETTKEITGFKGANNDCRELGKLFIDDLKVGDKLQISFDATYSDLTAAADQTASLHLQGWGDVTEWSVSVAGEQKNWLGTKDTSTTYSYEKTMTADMIQNEYFMMRLRTDYYASGSITITNLKAVRVTSKTESKPYGTQLGTLHTISGTVDTLNGWYTAASGGTKIATTTVVTGNATYYAQWNRMVASTTIGSTTTKYSTVQAAINAAGTNSGATVTLLEPRRTENITISSGQNIIFNTNKRILSSSNLVIGCSGTVSINGGGKIEGTTTNPAVKNSSSGTVTITNTTVISNAASAVRNESSGKVTIESGTFKSSGTNASTVANTGAGTTTINGGTISSANYRGVTITSGNLIVGKSTETSTTSPEITATASYAIASTKGNITVYGGKITGTRCIDYNGTGSIEIKGGNLTSTQTGTINISRNSSNPSGAILAVTGGTITSQGIDAINNMSTSAVVIGQSSSTSQTSPSIKGRVYSYYADSSSNVLTTGSLKVYSGLITATTQHAIYATGSVYIEGGKITASKNHTVILGNNNSASMEIRGNPIIENTSTYRAASTNNRATQNLDISMSGGSITSTGGIAVNNEKGTTTVYGGTITGKTYGIYTTTGTIDYRASISTTNSVTATGDEGVGMYATTGTITVGKENTVLQEKPKIKGKKYGIQITGTAGTLNFHDCIVYGGTSAIVNAGTLNVKSGYGINISTETTTIGTASVSCEKKMLVEANFLNYTTKSYYSNLTDAINTATSGDSIFVNKTVTDNATSAYNINKKIDLVIFSSDITLNVSQEFNVTSSGNLSFSGTGGRIESTAAVGVRNAGKFSFVNQFGSFKSTGECIYNNGGSVVIDGPGTNVVGHTTLSSSSIYTINNYRGSVEIKEARVYNSSDNGYGIYNQSGSTLTISGAYIIGYSGINNNGNAIVNSGDIIGRKSKGILNNGGTLTLGTTSASVTSQDSSIVPVVKGNAMGISGGTMNFYSGVVYGGLFAISDNSTTVVPRDGYSVITTTADTSIDGTTYTCKRAMLSK